MKRVRGNPRAILSKRYRKTRLIRGFLKLLSNVILISVTLSLLFGFLLPFACGGKWLIVLSGSMNPTFEVGGLAFVWPVNPTSIEVGDIIAYEAPNDPNIMVAHRVIEISDGDSLDFQTKGDANEEPDKYSVKAEDVKGEVLYHVPRLGYAIDYIRDFARKPLGFGLLLGLPSALIIGAEARNILFYLNPRKRREESESRRMKRIEALRRGRLWSKLF